MLCAETSCSCFQLVPFNCLMDFWILTNYGVGHEPFQLVECSHIDVQGHVAVLDTDDRHHCGVHFPAHPAIAHCVRASQMLMGPAQR